MSLRSGNPALVAFALAKSVVHTLSGGLEAKTFCSVSSVRCIIRIGQRKVLDWLSAESVVPKVSVEA